MNKITIPNSWTPPLYHLGQRVKQGEITGIEYHPPGTGIAYELGQGWTYIVLPDEYSDYVDMAPESQIELLTPSASAHEVERLIDLHGLRITALTEQMAQTIYGCGNSAVENMDSPFKQIEDKLAVAKEEALSAVVSQFVAAINRQGFTTVEFLEAVADILDKSADYEVTTLMEQVIAKFKACAKQKL